MLHREGFATLAIVLLALLGLNALVFFTAPALLRWSLLAGALFFLFIVQFFRYPRRSIPSADDNLIYAPADGKVVVIEEAEEPEYFQGKRLQISIFMSPLNVHVNWNPLPGVVSYYRYHPGKYLVAWHPKASTHNERTTVVLASPRGEILIRQIAGAVARRIVNYLREGQTVAQGSEMGFIKFGSRVDLFLPLDAKVEVAIDQPVKGNQTVVARFS